MNKKKKIMPVSLLLIGVLIVGGISAAVLTMYGSFTATAQVQEAATLNGGDTYSFDGNNVVAGDTLVDDSKSVQSNANVDTGLKFVTSCDYDSGADETDETMNIDWVDACDGITTRYVEYYDNAGVYSYETMSSAECDKETGTDIQGMVDSASPGDTLCVKTGTYTEDVTVNVENVMLVSMDGQGAAKIEGTTELYANGVTLKGFELVETQTNGNVVFAQTAMNDITIENNYIHGTSDIGGTGIYLNQLNAGTGFTIINNKIENNWAGIGGTENFEGEIKYNKIFSNDEGVGVGGGQVFSTKGNIFQANIASFRIYTDSGTVDAENNYYHNGFNVDRNGNNNVVVNVDYETKSDLTLESKTTDKFTIINELSTALASGTYTITTEVQPVSI